MLLSQDPALYVKVVERIWSDPEFAARLRGNARAALGELGIAVEKDIDVAVLEDTDDRIYIVVPKRHIDPEVSDEFLEHVISATGNNSCFPTYCCTETCKEK